MPPKKLTLAPRWWLHRQSELAAFPDEKTCAACRQTKPVIDFYVDVRRKDGRQRECKVCAIAAVRTRQRAKRHARLSKLFATVGRDAVAESSAQ